MAGYGDCWLIDNTVSNLACSKGAMSRIIEVIQAIAIIMLILFGIFAAYQIVNKILGGSWETEDIILALLIFNIGFSFTIALNQMKSSSDNSYLRHQFGCLAKDFKAHLSMR